MRTVASPSVTSKARSSRCHLTNSRYTTYSSTQPRPLGGVLFYPHTPWRSTMTDPTKGDSPILDPGPIVEIDGTTYPLRRLGVRDTLTLAKVIAIGARAL